MPSFIEICKRTQFCRKNEIKNLGKLLEFVIKLLSMFTTIRENRNYLMATNRLTTLIDLFLWFLAKPSKLIFGIQSFLIISNFISGIPFIPQFFQILTVNVKHRVGMENMTYKENFVEYLICCNLLCKIKNKIFQFVNEPLDLSGEGSIPQLILKALAFIEALTHNIHTNYYNFHQNIFQ